MQVAGSGEMRGIRGPMLGRWRSAMRWKFGANQIRQSDHCDRVVTMSIGSLLQKRFRLSSLEDNLFSILPKGHAKIAMEG